MLCERNRCSGCGACAEACPNDSIAMEPDEYGFLYPQIKEVSCLHCGICESVCPVLRQVAVSYNTVAYAAMELDETARITATSGGVFEVLANWALDQGGTVFGAAYDEFFAVHHIAVNNGEDLEKLKGAKYSQSSTGVTFHQAKVLLEQGEYVLYSGTACQIAGLKSFLGKDYDKLLCVDLICHGVPAPAVWQHYVDYRAAKDNDGVRPAAIYQRNKDTGWPGYSVKFEYQNRSVSYLASQDPFMRGFIADLYLRPSCFHCIGKGIERAADFTLGDYWGIEGQLPEMHDGKGTSLVLVHSDKARNVWDAVSQQLKFQEVFAETALQHNPMAISNTVSNPKSEDFAEKWKEQDYEELVWSLVPKPIVPVKATLVQRLKNKVRRILKG